jgi:transposase
MSHEILWITKDLGKAPTSGQLAKGLTLSQVARRVQASVGSVYHWRQAWRTGGEEALAPKPVPGRPRKLTAQPCEQLVHILS